MVFEEIELYNIFSYFDRQTLDLRGAEDGRNIAVISGRNGYGKTNCINALKILFGGITQEMIEGAAITGAARKLTLKSFVVGSGEDWYGLLNRKAARLGEKECWVKARWKEDDGTVVAKRSWEISGNRYSTWLSIKTDFLGENLEDDDAQQFLERRLPESYLPFFFFDSEKIRYLAEISRNALKEQIELVLNIKHVDVLNTYIGKVSTDWKRQGMQEAERASLEKYEAELRVVEAEIRKNEEEQDFLRDEIEKIESEIAGETKYLESMRAFENRRDARVLEEKRRQLKDRMEKRQLDLSEKMPVDAPLLANKGLVEKALRQLKALERVSSIPGPLLGKLRRDLPVDMFNKPPYPEPPLTIDQKSFLEKRLARLMRSYLDGESPASDSLFENPPFDLEALRGLLSFYAGADELRRRIAGELLALRNEKAELSDIDAKLQDSSTLGADERLEYEKRQAKNEERRNRLVDLKTSLNSLKMGSRGLISKRGELKKNIELQLEKVKLSESANRKYKLSKKLTGFFDRFKSELKSNYRSCIESSINEHFQELMTSHKQVSKVTVDDDFGLHFKDEFGEFVPMGSFSEGMKQLAATALVWALKDVSRKTAPVVVDTPLARIDLDHQNNLLLKYYPNAARQVILLPSDSELDRIKYDILKPRIYKEYLLKNESGDSSEFEETAIYDI